MARKMKNGGRGQPVQGSNPSKRIVLQSVDSKKTRSINVIQGIVPLGLSQVSSSTAPAMTRARSSTGRVDSTPIAIVHRKTSWADMKEEESAGEIGTNLNLRSSEKANAQSWSKVVGPIPAGEGLDLTGDVANKDNV